MVNEKKETKENTENCKELWATLKVIKKICYSNRNDACKIETIKTMIDECGEVI